MQFASLGSGSRGNATLIEEGDTCLLIDCGFALQETLIRLERLDRQPQDIDAILVTHEHSDHVRGAGPFSKRFGTPVYATHGTSRYPSLQKITKNLEIIGAQQTFSIGDLMVESVPVPHDAREPCQYVFQGKAKKLGILTDLGTITPFIVERYQGCDALLLECNHDPEMLMAGPYPYALKKRVGGDYGHLSNGQAGTLLQRLGLTGMQQLVVSHISETNNCPDLARDALVAATGCDRSWPVIANQDAGLAWQSVI